MKPSPPQATKKPRTLTIHNDSREDNYFWLRERDNPEAITYLEAENEHTSQSMAHTEALQKELVAEMKSRIADSDETAPVRHGPYEYYSRINKADDYYAHYRRLINDLPTEQLLIDENKLAAQHNYFSLNEYMPSPTHSLLAYGVDTKGDEVYTIHIQNLSSEPLTEVLHQTSGDFVWSSDSCIYYTTLNSAHRSYRLYRHQLGTNQDEDELLIEESDEAFDINVSNSDSYRFIRVDIASAVTTECYLIDAADDTAKPILIFSRSPEIEYYVADHGDSLFVLTNEDAINFKIMETALDNPSKSNWTTLVAHSESTTLTSMQMFNEFLLIDERTNGLPEVSVIHLQNNWSYRISKPEKIQELRIGDNRKYDTNICRLQGTALAMLTSDYDFNIESKTHHLVRTQPIGGDFDPDQYTAETHFVKTCGEVEVPLHLVYKNDIDIQRPAPLLLYGYGSYGISYPLRFSARRLSLLDRGIIFAVAHIRGGGEKGKNWYYDGRRLKKKNTFYDFEDCTEYLLAKGITSPDKLAICGGSAGGLVIGHFLNNNPNKCKAALAMVPFVDIVSTILDDSLPLSIHERDEWGDPNDAETYHYMKSYSPYDNVKAQPYPALLITAGFNDPRVGYWEPAKWAAKIRSMNTSNQMLCLKTEMQSGHFGASGRYDSLLETAMEWAYVIDQLLPNYIESKD